LAGRDVGPSEDLPKLKNPSLLPASLKSLPPPPSTYLNPLGLYYHLLHEIFN